VYAINAALSLKHSLVKRNIAGSRGGGIFLSHESSISVAGSQISNNTGILDGGQIYNSGTGEISLSSSVFDMAESQFGSDITVPSGGRTSFTDSRATCPPGCTLIRQQSVGLQLSPFPYGSPTRDSQVQYKCTPCPKLTYSLAKTFSNMDGDNRPDAQICMGCPPHSQCLGGSRVVPAKDHWGFILQGSSPQRLAFVQCPSG
jgi:hypothetical protein